MKPSSRSIRRATPSSVRRPAPSRRPRHAPALVLALASAAAGTAGAQQVQTVPAPRSATFEPGPLRTVVLDLETGTIRRDAGTAEHRGASTVATFSNLDLAGFTGVDTGGGATEWFDAAWKAGGASERMTGFTTAYCSSALDPELGGPGGSLEISFREGYAGADLDGTPGGDEVTRVCLTGLPAHSTSSSFQDGYSCYFLEVNLGATVCFPDGPIGYGWRFVDVGSDGALGATFPMLSCVQDCAGPGPDSQGMVNQIDRYLAPGLLHSSFSFGQGYFTSMAMAIHEQAGGWDRVRNHGFVDTHHTQNEGEKTDLTSEDLVEALHARLGDAGFKSLIVEISGCRSGAFIEDLTEAFIDATMPVFGNSSCRFNEKVWTTDPFPRDATDSEVNGWVFVYSQDTAHPGYVQEGANLVNKNPSESDAVRHAKQTRLWQKVKDKANPQSLSLAGGRDSKLGDADKRVAVLFNGCTETFAWNDMGLMYRMLRRSGYKATDIIVLNTDGVTRKAGAYIPKDTFKDSPYRAATRKKMKDAIAGLAVDDDTQVYVYIGGHGGNYRTFEKVQVPARAAAGCANSFDLGLLTAEELEDLEAPGNTALVELTVTPVTCGEVPYGYEVYLNDTFLASIPGGGMLQELHVPVDPSLFQPSSNVIWIGNPSETAAPITAQVGFSAGLSRPDFVALDPEVPLGGLTPGGQER